MKDFYNTADVTTSTIGLGYSIYNIKEILGIIVLILTIANIVIKLCLAIYNRIKKKEFNKIPEEIDNTIEKFKEVNKDE